MPTRPARRADSLAAASAAAGPVDTTPAAGSWVMRPIVVAPDSASAPQAAGAAGDSAQSGASGVDSTAPAPATAVATRATRQAPTRSRRLDRRRCDRARLGQVRPRQAAPAQAGEVNGAATRSRRPTRRAGRSRAPSRCPARCCPSTGSSPTTATPSRRGWGSWARSRPTRCCPSSSARPREWAKADPGRKVMPALHLIATVAQGKPGGGRQVSAAPLGQRDRAGAGLGRGAGLDRVPRHPDRPEHRGGRAAAAGASTSSGRTCTWRSTPSSR